ncbi:MAG: TlpA family protein disulfide reductase [Bacteroidales bacterium]|nr:TlpA family protein disulfide reductase [Bacteroidales bacterium]MCF8390882.1 TlpA family protein disulfide reductase [Bacteroidales bacterium]
MIKHPIILVFLSFLFSCLNPSTEAEINTSFLIYGNMEDGNGYKLYITRMYADSSDQREIIEINQEGAFSKNVYSLQPDFYSLVNEAGNAITLFCGPGDSIEVKANYYDFRDYTLSGNSESEQISQLNMATQGFLKKITLFSAMIEDSIESQDYAQLRMNIDREYREEYSKLKSFSKNLILENKSSPVSLLALSNQLGKNFFVFYPLTDKEIFYFVDSCLYSEYPLYEPVKNLHYQVNSLKKAESKKSMFQIGDKLPSFSLPDTSGKIINLQTLKGKVIFVDFWASWCKSCRDENIKYLELYPQYLNKGFEIVQISLDNSKEEWKRAIEQDGLPWLQLSDLMKWDSETIGMYDIKELPANFLLNPSGEILAIDIDALTLKKQLNKLLISK